MQKPCQVSANDLQQSHCNDYSVTIARRITSRSSIRLPNRACPSRYRRRAAGGTAPPNPTSRRRSARRTRSSSRDLESKTDSTCTCSCSCSPVRLCLLALPRCAMGLAQTRTAFARCCVAPNTTCLYPVMRWGSKTRAFAGSEAPQTSFAGIPLAMLIALSVPTCPLA